MEIRRGKGRVWSTLSVLGVGTKDLNMGGVKISLIWQYYSMFNFLAKILVMKAELAQLME